MELMPTMQYTPTYLCNWLKCRKNICCSVNTATANNGLMYVTVKSEGFTEVDEWQEVNIQEKNNLQQNEICDFASLLRALGQPPERINLVDNLKLG